MNKTSVLVLSSLLGTVIGAGIFALPYAVSRSGLFLGLSLLFLLGIVVLFLHLFMGEICLRTPEKLRLVGYAQKYLGSWGKIFVTFSTLFSVIGSLLAYIILGGEFLKILAKPFLDLPDIVFPFVFWIALSLLITQGIQLISRLELFMNIALFAAVGVIFFYALPHVEFQNLSTLAFFPGMSDFSRWLLPYGVALFSFIGWNAIPEIADLMKKTKEKRALDNIIVWASVIVVALYLLFIMFVLGVSGMNTTEDALIGLEPLLGSSIVYVGAIFGFFAVATSFLIQGNYLKNSLRYDFKFPWVLSMAVSLGIPFVLFLIGIREFIEVVAIVGAVMGALEGVAIVWIFFKAKQKGGRKPEYSIPIPKIFLIFFVVLLLLGALGELVL